MRRQPEWPFQPMPRKIRWIDRDRTGGRMSGTLGTGHFFSWQGGFLVIGSAAGITPMHAHYAIQVAFGSEPGIRFRPSEREPWTPYDGVVISSRQPHSMDASIVPFDAVIFVEPETREGRALSERFSTSGITPLSAEVIGDVGSALFSSWQNERSSVAVEAAARAVIKALTAGVEPSVVSDERILRATAYIRSHLNTSLTLDDVADVACLSPSRFRHLFVEQTGMALRPYVLWRRFLRVWELIMEGESLSTAAHSAGFADAAHLTRTSRRMFGFPPSALQIAGPLRRGADAAPRVRGESALYSAPSHQPRVR
jgi:AraC family transcriptional regulator